MGDDTVTIRRATEADRVGLRRLCAELIRVHAGFDSLRFPPAEPALENRYEQFLIEQTRADDGIVLVAMSGAEMVGYAYAALEPESLKELRAPAGFIHDLAVAASARRRGIGRALLTAALEWLREQNAARVLLGTATQNTAAQKLFREFGFRQTMLEMTREWPSSARPVS